LLTSKGLTICLGLALCPFLLSILSLGAVVVVGEELRPPARLVPVEAGLGDIFAMFPERVRAADLLPQGLLLSRVLRYR
jgi:hypothetical protein